MGLAHRLVGSDQQGRVAQIDVVVAEVLNRTDDELISLMIEETSLVIGTRVQPSWTRVVRHNPGIPQYNVGHVGWMRKLDAAITNYPGLHLTGWGYRGIGVSGMGTEAVRIGDQIGA